MGKLTDRALRNAKPTGTAYKLADGGGLYVNVGRTGTRTWRYRFRFNGEQTTVTLGEYPALGLEEARRRHLAARQRVREGHHPDRERQTESTNTLESVAKEWIDEGLKTRTPAYRRHVVSAMQRHVFPSLGTRPIRSITPPEVLELLRIVERTSGPAAALLLRGWIGSAFRYGVATGKCERNPVTDLHGAMPRHKPKHYRTITARDIPTFLTALETDPHCRRSVKVYLKMLLMTFVRPGELADARWDEVDLPSSLWRIPAERMKGRREHLVPLSAQVLAMLKELQVLTAGSEYLFPAERDCRYAMDRDIPRRALKCLRWHDRLTLHGFRSLASTCLNEMGWRADVIEMQLAHKELNATRAAYNRASYMPERIRMMQSWSDFVTSSNVVPLRGAA